MPRRSGRDVGREALAAGAGLVVVSGHQDRVEVDDLLAAERVRFLAKPYTAESLLAAVAEVLAPTAAR